MGSWMCGRASVVFAVVSVLGCSDAAEEHRPAFGVFGPAGGALQIAGGTRISVPKGALSTEVEIRIAVSDSAPAPLASGLALVGSVYSFTPHGTTFAIPATIRIPAPSAKGTVYTLSNDQDRTWEAVTGVTRGSGAFTFSVDHISYFAEFVASNATDAGTASLDSSADAAVVLDAGIAVGRPKASVFFTFPADSHDYSCFQFFFVDRAGSVFLTDSAGNVYRILPSGAVANGWPNYFATGGSDRYLYDAATNKLYSEAWDVRPDNTQYGKLMSSEFCEGARMSPLTQFATLPSVSVGKGALAGNLLVWDGPSSVSLLNLSTLALRPFAKGTTQVPTFGMGVSAPDGTVYALGSSGLVRISTAGVVTPFASRAAFDSGNPYGEIGNLAVDPRGNVYWAFAAGIDVFAPNGSLLATLPGPPDQKYFVGLTQMEFDPSGNLFILDNGLAWWDRDTGPVDGCQKVYKYEFTFPDGHSTGAPSSVDPTVPACHD